jgi:hypothetical protein
MADRAPAIAPVRAEKRAAVSGARRAISDLASQLSGIALIVAATAVFLAGAIGGLTQIGRLGSAGWIIYVVVVGTLALAMGPLIATGVTLHQHGSRRHRAATERRVAEQRQRFALDLSERTRADELPGVERPDDPV